MQVYNYRDNTVDLHIDNSLHASGNGARGAERLDTRNPSHYGLAHFDGIGAFHLAHAYADRHADIVDMLKVLSTTGTGGRIVAELRALSEQGVRIAIGPRDDLDPDPELVPVDGVSTTVDGQVLWDCYYGLRLPATGFDPGAYRMLVLELARVRNLAAEKGWPGVPPLQPKDVESAFMAELALRTVPALAQSGYVPTFPATPHEFDAEYMPDWSRGPIHFDTLSGLMPAWFTDPAKESWDEVRTVLQTVQQTALGQRLLTDLWVYGRSRAVMLIHRSTSGKDGVRRLDDETPIWSFDTSTLATLAGSDQLTEGEAQASGAFRNLLMVHGMLASKLGMLAGPVDASALQYRFEQQLLEERTWRLNAMTANIVPQRERHHAAWPLWEVEAARDQRSPFGYNAFVSRPSTAAAGGASPRLRPVEPAAAVLNLGSTSNVAAAAGDVQAGAPAVGRSDPPARRGNGVARWLRNSARAFTRSFNRSPSVPPDPNGRLSKRNPYADSSARPSGN